MHYHLEIIMPPTQNVKEAIEKILEPFDENNEEAKHAFWDWWVIGGRYSGQHLTSRYEPNRLDEFYEDLAKNKVTVSGLVAGKQELNPPSWIPFVDELWQHHFPDADGPCPIFKHSNDQYKDNYADVCQVFDMPKHLTCSRIIITDKDFRADLMLESSYWNGVSWCDAKWDGSVSQALSILRDKRKHYTSDWLHKNAIDSNWLLVTVDYHS